MANSIMDLCGIPRPAQTVIRQAERLGFEVEIDRANYTNSTYLIVTHAALGDDDLLIRISDHDGNEARYRFRVNRRPDMACEFGLQHKAVEWLARKINVDPSTIPYLKSIATRERREAAKLAGRVQKVVVDQSRVAERIAHRRCNFFRHVFNLWRGWKINGKESARVELAKMGLA